MTDQKLSTDVGAAYIGYCRRRIIEEYLPRVKSCIALLSEDDIWWRAHETDNSIGNLLLHLGGNMRQWIIAGIGGVPGIRERAKEFSARTHNPKEELWNAFEETVREVDTVLASFDTSKLLEMRHIQVYDVTCLDAISHVIEHFAQHLGQIIYITKLRTGKDMRFYNL